MLTSSCYHVQTNEPIAVIQVCSARCVMILTCMQSFLVLPAFCFARVLSEVLCGGVACLPEPLTHTCSSSDPQ